MQSQEDNAHELRIAQVATNSTSMKVERLAEENAQHLDGADRAHGVDDNDEVYASSVTVQERCELLESCEPTTSNKTECSDQAELLQTPRQADASARTPLTSPSH